MLNEVDRGDGVDAILIVAANERCSPEVGNVIKMMRDTFFSSKYH